MKKRIFAFLMAMLLCLSYVPGVFASEEAEEPQPAEETEVVEDAEPIEDAEPVEEAEPIEEAAPVEEAEPVEEAAPVEETDPVEEAEPVEEADLVEEVEPVEEAEPAEEPAPAAEAPALDGVTISGTLNAYQFSDNAALELKGDTTLNINADKTIQSISGSYSLTINIQSGKTLTVKNTNGHAISVSALTVSGSGAFVVTASKDGLNSDGDINITGVSITVTAEGNGVYSHDGGISMDCTATVKSTGGSAICAPWGKITLGGNIMASTIDGESYGIECGGTRNSSLHLGQISFREGGTYTVTAKGAAVYAFAGFIEISGHLTATSSEGIAVLSNIITGFSNGDLKGTITIDGAVVEANGEYTGIRCGGNIVIMGSEITASGSSYAIYAGDGFTMDSRLQILTPGTGKFQGSTVVYSGDVVAKTVVIGLKRITGTAKLIYPGDKVYVDDTVSLELTDVPATRSIQWERSENGWSNFEDIPGETGLSYKVRPEDSGWKIQARITAPDYSGEIIGGGAFVFSRPISSAAIAVTAPEAGEDIWADGLPGDGSNFMIVDEYWCTGMSPSSVVTGRFGIGMIGFTHSIS